jgi:hypothetical protein
MADEKEISALSEQGPASYLNWRAALQGKPLISTFEYPLYTDAHIVAGVRENRSNFSTEPISRAQAMDWELR